VAERIEAARKIAAREEEPVSGKTTAEEFAAVRMAFLELLEALPGVKPALRGLNRLALKLGFGKETRRGRRGR
jgi:hypothetical protein